MVEVLFANSESLKSICEGHPRIVVTPGQKPTDVHSILEFRSGFGPRRISRAHSPSEGIVLELEDQNPLMCAEAIYVASALETARQLLLKPLVSAGFLDPGWNQNSNPLKVREDVLHYGYCLPTDTISKADVLECWHEKFDRCPSIRIGDIPTKAEWPTGVVVLSCQPNENGDLSVELFGFKKGRLGEVGLVQLLNIACGFDERLGLEKYF